MVQTASGAFNISKGSWAKLCTLPLGTDALEIILFQSSGLVADTVMRDYATVAAIKAANTEATFTNYARLVYSSGITVTTNQASDNTTMTMSPTWTWNSAGGATNNTLGKWVIAYRATSGAADSAKIPIGFGDFSATTTGTNLTASFTTLGTAS